MINHEPRQTAAPVPLIMGVLNITTDSFSDGGKYLEPQVALEHARNLIAEGANIIDIGGESTRPGAERVSLEQEQFRVLPVIEALVKITRPAGVRISIDTMNAETARLAVAAGADIVNDVSGGLADPTMLEVVAHTGATYVMGHWRGFSKGMDALASYDSVSHDVARELSQRVEAALQAGISRERIVVDPGLGFSKDADHNWELLGNLEPLFDLGRPVLIGASRKRFIAARINPNDPASVTNEERDVATAQITAELAHKGVWGFRVHDVKRNVEAILALRNAGHPRASSPEGAMHRPVSE